MNILECIRTRRSIRTYTDRHIEEETLRELLTLGVKAATGSNEQPWGFAVIQDREEIRFLSETARAWLLENLDAYPYFEQYREWLDKPSYSVFNHADTLLLIYGDTASHWYVYDCTLCAANIMLAAHSMGIGSCWLGFGEHVLDTPEFKRAHNVPGSYSLVCPMSLGYSKGKLPPSERRDPLVFSWHKA